MLDSVARRSRMGVDGGRTMTRHPGFALPPAPLECVLSRGENPPVRQPCQLTKCAERLFAGMPRASDRERRSHGTDDKGIDFRQNGGRQCSQESPRPPQHERTVIYDG